MSIPDRHKKLNSAKGFDELFSKEIAKADTYEEAFQQLYMESVIVFGKCRYKNYKSYERTRRRRINSLSSN